MHRNTFSTASVGCAILAGLLGAGCNEMPQSPNTVPTQESDGVDVNAAPRAEPPHAAVQTAGWHALPPARDVLNGRVPTFAISGEPRPFDSTAPYDFDHGNIATDVIIPSA